MMTCPRMIRSFLVIFLAMWVLWLPQCFRQTFAGEQANDAHRTKKTEPGKISSAVTEGKYISGPETVQQEVPGAEPENLPSVDFYKTDLHNVFILLGKVSGKNIVVDESVTGTLTLSLRDVPWTFVLDVIKNLKGLSSIEHHNTIMIFPKDKSITWAGPAGASGTLDINPVKKAEGTLDVTEKGMETGADNVTSDLLIESAKGTQTPLDQIIRANKFLRKAQQAERDGDLAKAIKLYAGASGFWPDNVAISKKIAFLSLARGENNLEALNYAKMALRFSPDDSEAATLAGIALSRMGKNADAALQFEKAVAGESPPYQSLYNFAVFCFSRAEYRKSLGLIEKIELKHSVTAEVLMLKAQVFEHLGNLEKAMEEYRALLRSGSSIPPKAKRYAEDRLMNLAAAKN